MKLRHRMPTIFSIYMVDVLCCALGCVILLWLINFREAKQRAAAASETNKRLTETKSALEMSTSELTSLRSALTVSRKLEQSLLRRIKIVQVERDKAQDLVLLTQKE